MAFPECINSSQSSLTTTHQLILHIEKTSIQQDLLK